MLTYEELLQTDSKKLKEELEEAKRNLFKTRLEVGAGQSKANHNIGKIKKYIAQINTVLNSKR